MRAAPLTGRCPGLLVAAAVLLASASASAQQTIFQDPSVDVLGTGEGMLEVAALARRLPGDDKMHFEGVTPRLLWGPGARLELGLDVGPFGADHGDPYMTPNLKLRLFEGSGALGSWTGVAGVRVYLPFRRSHDVLWDAFGIIGWRIGPVRLSGGGYADDRGADRVRFGWLASGEVFVGGRLRIAAEWWQRYDLGLGVVVGVGAGVRVSLAYLVADTGGRDREGVIAKVGVEF